MKGIIYWNLWDRRWSLIWWTVGISAMIVLALAFYPPFRDQAAEFNQSLSQIPDSAKALFSDTNDLFSPTGYLSSQIYYLMMPLLLGILSISLGSSLVAREEQAGTIELLLSRPVSRTKLLISKAIVALIIVSTVTLVSTIASVGMSAVVDMGIPLVNIALTALASMLLALSFGMVAFVVTMFGKARGASIGIAALFALAGYIIASLQQAASWLKYPAKAFPFDYYQPANILDGNYNWWNISFVIGVLVVGSIASWLLFRRRDIAG